jgi:hypothetical protein
VSAAVPDKSAPLALMGRGATGSVFSVLKSRRLKSGVQMYPSSRPEGLSPG